MKTDPEETNLWRETFTERVTHFSTDVAHVNVTFSVSAGAYRLLVSRDDFVELLVRLAAAWKTGDPIDVMVERDEIISVNPLEKP